jgi:hypothetical protein
MPTEVAVPRTTPTRRLIAAASCLAVAATLIVLVPGSRSVVRDRGALGSVEPQLTALPNSTLVASGRSDAVGSVGQETRAARAPRLRAVLNPLVGVRHVALAGDRRLDGVWFGPTANFAALGNNSGIGDCAVVAVASLDTIAALRSGHRTPTVTTAAAVAQWHLLNSDTAAGVSDSALLGQWASTTGVLGSHIDGWRSLDVLDARAIKGAISETGGLYASIVVADATPWTSVEWSHIPSESEPVTGHAVALIGWTRTGWIAVSWGEVISIPWSYWDAEAISAYAVTPR